MPMLTQILIYLLQTVVGFFTMMLIVRMVMRWMRISFINQLGQFVLATTNWAVLPLQRVLPSIGRFDTAALVPAWLLQSLLAFVVFLLLGASLSDPAVLIVHALLRGALELVRSTLYLLMFVVILGAVISWVNPYSPLAPTLNALTRPFLDPIRRIVPPVANIDLSPVLLLVVVQVLLIVLAQV